MTTQNAQRDRVILCLCHYMPNLSGLTLAAAEQARFLGARGHPVRVLTSRSKNQPARQIEDGIEIWRSVALLQIAKAPVMPLHVLDAWAAMKGAALVVIHLPHPDAAMLAAIARLRGAKVLLHHHCSLSTDGIKARVIRVLSTAPHLLAGAMAHGIQVVDRGYAQQSRFCRLFRHKLHFAPPPVAAAMLIPAPPGPARPVGDPLRVAFVGRIARQKSLPVLLRAFTRLEARIGRPVTLDLIGPGEGVIGETTWREILTHAAQSDGKVRHLGPQEPGILRRLYPDYDLLVLPSTDRQESFGLVQVEAMAQGVPVVACDLPGMRIPIAQTRMGVLVPPGSVEELTAAMARVLRDGPPGQVTPETLVSLFGAEVTCAPCLALLHESATNPH